MTAAALSSGLALGATYALLGVAVTAVALVTRTLHLAIGQVLVIGVLTRLYLGAAGVPAALAVAGGIAAAALLSALLEPLVLGPLGPRDRGDRGRDHVLAWLIGLAVAAAVVQAATGRWLSTRTFRPRPLLDLGDGWSFAGVDVSAASALALVAGLTGAGALAVALRWTRWGRRLRLVGGAPRAAALGGISPRRTRAGALAASGAVAALAGMLIAPTTFVGSGQAPGFTVRAVAAAALLSRGGVAPALAGGLLVGVVEAAGRARWPGVGGDASVALLVLVVLVLRGPDVRRAWGRAW